MTISVDYLRQELDSLKAQHANAVAVANQALGAISLIESLLSKADGPQDAITLEQLRDGLGAKSAEIVKPD